VGFAVYTDRFGTDDLSDRFVTLLQIGAAADDSGGGDAGDGGSGAEISTLERSLPPRLTRGVVGV
jgi:hypothetical protein